MLLHNKTVWKQWNLVLTNQPGYLTCIWLHEKNLASEYLLSKSLDHPEQWCFPPQIPAYGKRRREGRSSCCSCCCLIEHQRHGTGERNIVVIAQFYRVFSPSCPVSSNNGRRRRDGRFTFHSFWIHYQAQNRYNMVLLAFSWRMQRSKCPMSGWSQILYSIFFFNSKLSFCIKNMFLELLER